MKCEDDVRVVRRLCELLNAFFTIVCVNNLKKYLEKFGTDVCETEGEFRVVCIW
uniref:AlNc14C130G6934 protein n=1 Tax=Albugo laibachii Nc14 TaxID=890382 RepID=F0WK82_9STRA|nr:AlNc14C130G6934 [Albugo laibachii Nc14]|eukprot:CCA21685.1 AlNc14C130G6934 [Albugo laibachii Nc14]